MLWMIVLKRFFWKEIFFAEPQVTDGWMSSLTPKTCQSGLLLSHPSSPHHTHTHTHTLYISLYSLSPVKHIHILSISSHTHTLYLSQCFHKHTHTHTHFSPHHILIFVRTFNGIIGAKCKARIFITPAICFHHGPTGKNSRLIKITVPTSKI